MNKLTEFWQDMIAQVRAKTRKLVVKHEEVVAYAIENKHWKPTRQKIASIARRELKEAIRQIGYKNEHGQFIRTAYAVHGSQGWLIGGMTDAPEAFVNEYFRGLVTAARADCHQIVAQADEILKTRGIKVYLPDWVRDAAKDTEEGEHAA